MVLAIYQVVLMSLMFIFSLTSFSIMLASLTNYIKKKNNKEKQADITRLKNEIDFFNNELAKTTDKEVISVLLQNLETAKTDLAKLETTKKK